MNKKDKKQRAKKYETKVKINASFDEVLKVLMSSPPPLHKNPPVTKKQNIKKAK